MNVALITYGLILFSVEVISDGLRKHSVIYNLALVVVIWLYMFQLINLIMTARILSIVTRHIKLIDDINEINE